MTKEAIDLLARVTRRLCRTAGYPAAAQHMDCSLLLSEQVDSRDKTHLFDVALAAIDRARTISLTDIVTRMGNDFPAPYPEIWPGEHYKLLAGLVAVLNPKLVVEIGTGEGLSALTMLKFLAADSRLVSFDIVDWTNYPRSCLSASDFADGRFSQVLDDLSNSDVFEQHMSLLASADLIFLDGPKDGRFEPRVVELFSRMTSSTQPLFVFDDVRLWNMLGLWSRLEWNKLDLTSFGHWSGTGIAECPTGRSASTRVGS